MSGLMAEASSLPRVLAVDDDKVDLRYLVRIASKFFEIEECRSGEACRTLVDESTYDCVLLDLRLPDVHEHDLLDAIGKRVPVVVLSGRGDERAAVESMKHGAYDYLAKDEITPDALRAAVNGAIAKRAFESKIEEQRRKLIEDERLKVIMQLAGSTLHDINQPMTQLSLSLERMVQHGDFPDSLSTYAEHCSSGVKRITNVLRNIQRLRLGEDLEPAEGAHDISLPDPCEVLYVEDSNEDARKLLECVEYLPKVVLTRVPSVADARDAIEHKDFDIILADHRLCDGTSIDLLNYLKSVAKHIPLIVVTGQGNEKVASEVFRAGAEDYLSKYELDSHTLARTVINAYERTHLRNELEISREKMSKLAFIDSLTELYNRRFFEESSRREHDRIIRYGGTSCVALLDLDRFKSVNDNFGHAAGDAVIRSFAEILKTNTRSSDLTARYGGEEFALLMPNTSVDEAVRTSEKVREAVAATPLYFDEKVISVTVSVGVVAFSEGDGRTLEEILKAADEALYGAKDAGRDRVVVA